MRGLVGAYEVALRCAARGARDATAVIAYVAHCAAFPVKHLFARRRRVAPSRTLRQVDLLVAPRRTIGQACKESEIIEQSYCRWRTEYGGLGIEQANRFKELERENVRLKRLVADLSLEKQVLKDIAEGNL
jgi:hypothetical protein